MKQVKVVHDEEIQFKQHPQNTAVREFIKDWVGELHKDTPKGPIVTLAFPRKDVKHNEE